MEFNENLIKPEMDAEIYGEACPTLGTAGLVQYSTPAQHNQVIYAADGLFFSTFPHRRMYLREANAGEWEPFKGWDHFNRKPKLWVLVMKLAEGFHERTPRWRGQHFWNHPDTDEQAAALLVEIAQRGGMKLSEWMGYVSDKRVSNHQEARKASRRKRRY